MTDVAGSAACRSPLAHPTRGDRRRLTLRRVLVALGLGVGATTGALLIATTAHADDTGATRTTGCDDARTEPARAKPAAW